MLTSSGSTGGRGGRSAKTIISPNTSFGDIIMGQDLFGDIGELKKANIRRIKKIPTHTLNVSVYFVVYVMGSHY